MKRSNRLVLLVGIFLAIVAFVLIAILLSSPGSSPGGPKQSEAPTTVGIVVAANDIALGATIQATDVTTKDVPANQKPSDAYTNTIFVVGQIARTKVTAGQYISTTVLNQNGSIKNVEVPPGLVGIAVQVDQISGVGTIIKPGDFVDVISGFTGPDNVPLVIPAPVASNAPANAPVQYIKVDDNLYNHATVKALAQGLQVLGTLLPPPTEGTNAQASQAPAPSGQPTGGGSQTTLNGQQQIVILAATPQQAELIKFSQMSGSITLVLRSPEDCTTGPDASAEPSASPTEPGQYCPIIATTGVTLRRAVDDNGVLPPQVVQVLVPSPLPGSVVRR